VPALPGPPQKFCSDWAAIGECERNAPYMHIQCKVACGLCSPQKSTFQPGTSGLAKELARVTALLRSSDPAAAGGAAKLVMRPPAPPLRVHQEQEAEVRLEPEPMGPAREAAGGAAGGSGSGSSSGDGGGSGDSSSGDGGGGSNRKLVRRCFKQASLTMQQVQECVRAAHAGREWHPGDGAGAGGSAPGGAHPLDAAADATGPHAAAAAGDNAVPRSKWAARASQSGALMAWFGVVGMFLSVLPRLYHRARRRGGPHDGGGGRAAGPLHSPRKIAV
jgi:hypothetical protein